MKLPWPMRPCWSEVHPLGSLRALDALPKEPIYLLDVEELSLNYHIMDIQLIIWFLDCGN